MPPIHPLLGAHVSVAGGLPTALERGVELGCDALQIFVKNNSRWRGRELTDDEARRFAAAREAAGIGPVFAHASYLLNLASPDATTHRRSLAALGDELDRCDRLALDGLVVHPGAHVGAGEDAGLDRVRASIDCVLARYPGPTPLLLELTAGQGTVLGHRLEHLAALRTATDSRRSIGVCIDTCHAFAAGYPIHTRRGYESFCRQIAATVGTDAVGCFHLNDSTGDLGSRRDRHANLGRGAIGLPTFRRLVADSTWQAVPMILETPRGDDGSGHRRDLARLRGTGG
jgi:deoxyribonuclease-4